MNNTTANDGQPPIHPGLFDRLLGQIARMCTLGWSEVQFQFQMVAMRPLKLDYRKSLALEG